MQLQTTQNGLSIYNLPGIGKRTPYALEMYGIKTIEQFSLFTDNEVVALLGKSGRKLLRAARDMVRIPRNA